MSDETLAPVRPTRWTAMRRGFVGVCPKCGKGALFQSYLKLNDHCTACGELFSDIRADDIPAWATILVVGHITIPFFVVAVRNDWPLWIGYGVMIPAVLILTMILLPRFKGMIASLLWSLGMRGGAPVE
jgi:uncharacterized protein (DUF983 family)